MLFHILLHRVGNVGDPIACRAILSPSKKLWRVTWIRSMAASLTLPQGKVAQQSPWKPSR